MPWRVRRRGRGGLVLIAALFLVGAAITGCPLRREAVRASITVSPSAALFDTPITVSVHGLPAGAETTVSATATDASETTWSASAVFRATAGGVVSLDQVPLDGSYTKADPMGLLQFMTPVGAGAEHDIFVQPLSGEYQVVLTVTVDRRTVATARVRRQTPAAVGVLSRDLQVSTDGVYGTLFRPRETTARRPAVLVFGGSEGDLAPGVVTKAALLAAHGYPSLALAYFHAPGLPDTLTAIPLEYFAKALAVLRAEAGVDPQRVFVRGASFGGEAALLLAASFPHVVNGVIAEVPNSYVDAAPRTPSRAAWSLRGRDLPHARAGVGAPVEAVDPGAIIPVERIHGPVLLTCGEFDPLWPSCRNVDDITRRLTTHRFAHPVTVLRYADGGHLVGAIQPYTSITNSHLTSLGGTLPGTQAANEDVHTKVLALLAAQ